MVMMLMKLNHRINVDENTLLVTIMTEFNYKDNGLEKVFQDH